MTILRNECWFTDLSKSKTKILGIWEYKIYIKAMKNNVVNRLGTEFTSFSIKYKNLPEPDQEFMEKELLVPGLNNVPKLNEQISLHSSLIWTLQVIFNTHMVQIEGPRDTIFWRYPLHTHKRNDLKLHVVYKAYANWLTVNVI